LLHHETRRCQVAYLRLRRTVRLHLSKSPSLAHLVRHDLADAWHVSASLTGVHIGAGSQVTILRPTLHFVTQLIEYLTQNPGVQLPGPRGHVNVNGIVQIAPAPTFARQGSAPRNTDIVPACCKHLQHLRPLRSPSVLAFTRNFKAPYTANDKLCSARVPRPIRFLFVDKEPSVRSELAPLCLRVIDLHVVWRASQARGHRCRGEPVLRDVNAHRRRLPIVPGSTSYAAPATLAPWHMTSLSRFADRAMRKARVDYLIKPVTRIASRTDRAGFGALY